jgi:hypothetical protein
MFGHSRCSLVLPTQLQMVLATDILNGRSHQSSDPTAREFAREILAVGREAPL